MLKFNNEVKEPREYVPESLEECQEHYVPPVSAHIYCPHFGHCDGTDGGCHWCREMTPYQWWMCSDETWLRSLMGPLARVKCETKEEAANFIESRKQLYASRKELKNET